MKMIKIIFIQLCKSNKRSNEYFLKLLEAQAIQSKKVWCFMAV